MTHEDTRNLIDRFKNKDVNEIVGELDRTAHSLEIAIENLERDFNMGTIVRSANAFGIRRVHIIGRRQWNKRGAMMTDKYLTVIYHKSVNDFVQYADVNNRTIVAIDNVAGATNLSTSDMDDRSILVFGSESSGISDELLRNAESILEIEQFGSTRSINVGVAAGIVMYEWLRRHKLT
jgi:tRNA G18 (ribose-2'-O)-methylase SpoU